MGRQATAEPTELQLPVRYLGSVNVWLLAGEPLTLIDTGPATADALETLKLQLSLQGLAIEDIALVLLTHHHLDHSGLAATIRECSGATIAAHRATAEWGRSWAERLAGEHEFTSKLIAEHGVPESLNSEVDRFFTEIGAESRPFETDVILSDGDQIKAGGRALRTVWRPGHSATDTLYVDDEADIAFVGDHLLARITTAVEMTPTELPGDERRRALMEYLGNLRRTQVMPLRRCYTGHGPTIDDHRGLIEERVVFHTDRLERIRRLIAEGETTAFDVARRLWSPETAAASPVLVVWEVLGHLDLLINRGLVREDVDESGVHRFRAKDAARCSSPISAR